MPRICRVLVVEDNGAVRDLLEEVFEQEGYRFIVVENGAAMRAALAAGDVDVVVIDVRLKGESGLDLAADAAGAGCAVVMTTGDHSVEPQLRASGHSFILKPYRLQALVDTVEAALTASRARCTRKPRAGAAPRPPA